MISEFLDNSRDDITTFLNKHLVGHIQGFPADSFPVEEIEQELLDFICSGKMFRGALCRLGFELFTDAKNQRVVALGAALELVQSAFLIHDDIMDRDIMRRGRPATHESWRLKAEERKITDPFHLGESMAICIGDLAIFSAYRLLVEFCGEAGVELTGLFSRELSTVATAQMIDILYGTGWNSPSEDEVLSLYVQKTGRYTFALPISAGALLANGPEEIRKDLEQAAELLGIAFQLKDDELGLFGDEETLGKPVGSDIREGKKTLYFLRLAEKGDDTKGLLTFFGRDDTGEEEIRRIQEKLEKLGIRREIAEIMRSATGKAVDIISKLNGVRDDARTILTELAEYNLARGR